MVSGVQMRLIGEAPSPPSRHPSESWDLNGAGAAIATGISQLSLG